jgi:hypothetical protein
MIETNNDTDSSLLLNSHQNLRLTLRSSQDEEGSWPIVECKDIGLVQFCHGAPGFILSLLAIRPQFPKLHTQIDIAIALGRRIVWEKGLLTKVGDLRALSHSEIVSGAARQIRFLKGLKCPLLLVQTL